MNIITIPAPCVARESRAESLCRCGEKIRTVRRYYSTDDFAEMLGGHITCKACGAQEGRDKDWKPVSVVLLSKAPQKIFIDEEKESHLG